MRLMQHSTREFRQAAYLLKEASNVVMYKKETGLVLSIIGRRNTELPYLT